MKTYHKKSVKDLFCLRFLPKVLIISTALKYRDKETTIKLCVKNKLMSNSCFVRSIKRVVRAELKPW